MSIISWPTSLSTAADFTIGQQRYDVTESSDSTGADAARLLGPPRWTVSLRSADAVPLAEAGAWEAMLLQLRGRVNHLALHDPVRAVPQGNLRGSPILNATAAAGATSLVLANVRHADNLLIYQHITCNAAGSSLTTEVICSDTTHSLTLTNGSKMSIAIVGNNTSLPSSAFVQWFIQRSN